VEKVEYNVTEEDVDNEIKKMQDSNGRIIEAEDRSVEKGDILTIDYEGYVDGERFEGGTAENQTLEIGSNKFIPGFEEQLIGKNKDEEVEINVKFPEEYHSEDLAGKDAMFKVKIHEIKVKELPQLDDEFAKDVSEFDTLEELKNDIRSKQEEQAKSREKAENENKVVEKAIEGSQVEIPEVMIERQIDTEVSEFDYRLKYQGLDINKYFELTQTTMEDLRKQFRDNAAHLVKGDLVLETISKVENIEATEEELNEELEKLAKQYKQEVDKLKKNMREEDLDYIKVGIIKGKTVKFLVNSAKLV